jgi:hypothetical protein
LRPPGLALVECSCISLNTTARPVELVGGGVGGDRQRRTLPDIPSRSDIGSVHSVLDLLVSM